VPFPGTEEVVSTNCVVGGFVASVTVVLVSGNTTVEDACDDFVIEVAFCVAAAVVLGRFIVVGNCVLVDEVSSVVLLVRVVSDICSVVVFGNDVTVPVDVDSDVNAVDVVGNCVLVVVVSFVTFPVVVFPEIGEAVVVIFGKDVVTFVVVCNGAVVPDVFEGNAVVLVVISGKVVAMVPVPGNEEV